MYKLPQNRKWKSDYSSDVFGAFVAAQNIDFNKEGYLQLAQRPLSVYSQDDDGDLDRVHAIAYFDNPSTDVYVIATRDLAFQMTLNDGVSISEIENSPSLASSFPDVVIFNSLAYVSDADRFHTWGGSAAGWTTDVVTGYTSGVPHPLCVFVNRNELAVGDANTVKTYNTSHSLQNTLTLPAAYQVVSIRYLENKLFIGTRNLHGGDAMVFVWNGSGTSAQGGYSVRCARVYSLCEYRNGIVAIVSSGQILRWNGGGFEPLKDYYGVEANFPVWYEDVLWQDEDAGTAAIGKVFNRGAVADGDLIYINVSSSVANNEGNYLLPNFPSGLWVFDPNVGLYHKALPTANKAETVSVSSMSSSVLTLSSAVQTQTGEPVFIDAVGDLTGISANLTYYAIVLTTTTIKLALTQADAYAGTYITLGGAAGSSSVVVGKNVQIGSVQDSEAGPVCLISPADLSDSIYNSPVVWASRTFKTGDVDATYDTINMLSNAFNVGYFVTPKFQAKDIVAAWGTLYQKIRGLDLDTDKIVVKYRVNERFGLPTPPMAGTYSDDTTVGSNSDYFGQVEVGDEVVITKGVGAGRSAHIISVDTNEVEMDEAMPNAVSTDEVEFYITDFKKLGQPITKDIPTVIKNYCQSVIGKDGTWVQFKIELRGTSRVAVEEMLLTHQTTIDGV